MMERIPLIPASVWQAGEDQRLIVVLSFLKVGPQLVTDAIWSLALSYLWCKWVALLSYPCCSEGCRRGEEGHFGGDGKGKSDVKKFEQEKHVMSFSFSLIVTFILKNIIHFLCIGDFKNMVYSQHFWLRYSLVRKALLTSWRMTK